MVLRRLNTASTILLLALVGACSSSSGGGGEVADSSAAPASGTDELESLAASLDGGGGGKKASKRAPANDDVQINEGDLMAGDLKTNDAPPPADQGSADLALDAAPAAPAAEDVAPAAAPVAGGDGGLALTASGSQSMSLDAQWLQPFDGSAMGFNCKWKTLKDNGKIRHRVCSVEKKVVVNVLEKNRGSGPQLAKIVLDERGKEAFNRWKNSLKTAGFRGGKEKHHGSKTKSRYMSADHKSFADLIWNDNANAATFVMTPTAKGLGRELKKVAATN